MWDKLEQTEQRYKELEAEMAKPEVAADYDRLQLLAREHSALKEIIDILSEYRSVSDSVTQAKSIIDEGGDPDLVDTRVVAGGGAGGAFGFAFARFDADMKARSAASARRL